MTKILTRGSRLALCQAEQVKRLLREGEIVVVSTAGDRHANQPLREIGGKGLFVKEIEGKLLSGEGDVAVHSAKDMPCELGSPFRVVATLAREEPYDCLIARREFREDERIKIGSSSLRRKVQAELLYQNAEILPIRGNIDSRIERVRKGEFDGVILAKAGLNRLRPDLSGLTVRTFTADEMIPAACQGIIAVEALKGTEIDIEDNLSARFAFENERRFLRRIKADCGECVACYIEEGEEEGRVVVRAMWRGRKIKTACGGEEIERTISRVVEELL